MIKLNKCNGSYNVAGNVSTKTGVPSQTRDAAVKAFSMISRKNEGKT